MSDDEITGVCRDHTFETADDMCRRCGLEFCELCLVYPFGAGNPLCKECAMAEGGVRSHVQRAPMGKRELRRKIKAFKARESRISSNGSAPAEPEPVLTDPLAITADDLARVPATVPDTSATEDVTRDESLSEPPATPAQETGDHGDDETSAIDWTQPFG